MYYTEYADICQYKVGILMKMIMIMGFVKYLKAFKI